MEELQRSQFKLSFKEGTMRRSIPLGDMARIAALSPSAHAAGKNVRSKRAGAQMLIGVFFTPMSQSRECNARINKDSGVKNTPDSVRFVCFPFWATKMSKVKTPILESETPRGNWKSLNIKAFAIGAAAGAFVTIVMPGDWGNLAYSPWYIGWFVFPSFLVFASICIATLTDFISNDGANPYWLKALWALSGALVMGAYGLGISVLARLARRFGSSSGSRRE